MVRKWKHVKYGELKHVLLFLLGDHEDADIPETSPEQQEDTAQTQTETEGQECLVTF